MQSLTQQMLETEKLLWDYKYDAVNSEKKKKARKYSRILKRLSIAVLILFVIFFAVVTTYAFLTIFRQGKDEIFKFSDTGFVPSVDLFAMEGSNMGCPAFRLVFSMYGCCTEVWFLAALLISALGLLCCLIGKTPITDTFDLSPQREQPRLTKITPIRGIIIAIVIITIMYAILTVFLVSKITFPETGIDTEWLFIDTNITTAAQYISIHLTALFLSVFAITSIALGPFVYYYFSERKQAKRQLEYERIMAQYVVEKAFAKQDKEMVQSNYREERRGIIETKICNLYVGEQHREEEIINQYASFGWRLVGKSIVNRTMSDDTSYVSKVSLTFQRNTGLSNYEILNTLFEKYLKEEEKIARAEGMKKNDITAFIVISVISSVILLPILSPMFVSSELGIVMDFFGILITICCGSILGALLGALPVSIINKRKRDHIIKPAVYRNMQLIANKARTYL